MLAEDADKNTNVTNGIAYPGGQTDVIRVEVEVVDQPCAHPVTRHKIRQNDHPDQGVSHGKEWPKAPPLALADFFPHSPDQFKPWRSVLQ